MPIREPANQKEVDRNTLIVCWLMILPSVVLYSKFNPWILGMLLIGGFLRLVIDAIRLPNGQRGFYKVLFIAPSVILALIIKFEKLTSAGWIFLTFFIIFVAYADWRFIRYNSEQKDP